MPDPSVPSITLRPATGEDLPFLYRVYAATRTEELAPLDWTDAQREAFLRMQFDAQHRHYHDQRPDADYLVVVKDGQPAGRLYLDRGEPGAFHVIDISILPEFRGQGIGTHLLADILDEAAATGRPVRIYVEHFNRAMTLYRRLGFIAVSDLGIYYLMERPAPARATAQAGAPGI